MSYVELRDLKPGDRLFPFNTFNSNGYRQVCGTGELMSGGNRRNRRQYRLIHEFTNGPVDPKKYALHHRDFDGLNDAVNNIEVMTHEDHRKLHSALMMGEMNPYHRMTDEWKYNFASHPGEKNPRFSGHTNDELIDEGRKIFKVHGKLTPVLWRMTAKKNGMPQFLSNDFRFGSFDNFKKIGRAHV